MFFTKRIKQAGLHLEAALPMRSEPMKSIKIKDESPIVVNKFFIMTENGKTHLAKKPISISNHRPKLSNHQKDILTESASTMLNLCKRS